MCNALLQSIFTLLACPIQGFLVFLSEEGNFMGAEFQGKKTAGNKKTVGFWISGFFGSFLDITGGSLLCTWIKIYSTLARQR
jgi:hypothetical protein